MLTLFKYMHTMVFFPEENDHILPNFIFSRLHKIISSFKSSDVAKSPASLRKPT